MREPSSWSERGPCLHIVMVWCDDSAGVVEQGKGTEGSPGTWEILSSPWKKSRSGTPGNKTPGPSFLHSATTGDTKRAECSHGIAKRRKRSAARRATGSRSAPIVPSKPGNLLERTRWREAGAVSNLNRNCELGVSRRKPLGESENRGMRGGGC